MNRQTFSEYLEQPSKLYQLSLTELQGLVLEYPYSANLRQLLLLKAKLNGHPHAAEMLQQAAARTFDRGHLYDLLQELERDGLENLGQQEKLELQDLNKLEFELMPATEVDESVNSLAASDLYPIESSLADFIEEEVELDDDDAYELIIDDQLPEPTVLTEDEELEVGDVIDLSPIAETGAKEPAVPIEAIEPQLEETIPIVELKEELAPVPSLVKNQTASVFTHDMGDASAISLIINRWHADVAPPPPAPLEQLKPVASRRSNRLTDRLRKHKQRQLAQLDQPVQEDQVEEIARKSVASQREVASETLAKLLERQGQYSKAIKMYKRLCLLYPEKKSIFAALIKNLKEKL